jgi:integrase/recombinase XerD
MAVFPTSVSDVVSSDQLVVRAAASAFLGRYRGQTRVRTDPDLRVFLRWCTDQDLNPLTARRVDVERYVRWLQEARRYQPSTVSRRLSVVVGFYRVCVIDAILEHSPADYVRNLRSLGSGASVASSCLAQRGLRTSSCHRRTSNPFIPTVDRRTYWFGAAPGHVA